MVWRSEPVTALAKFFAAVTGLITRARIAAALMFVGIAGLIAGFDELFGSGVTFVAAGVLAVVLSLLLGWE